MTDYNALKVPDLKKLLQTRSLAVSGNKAELVARLQESDQNEDGVKESAEQKGSSETAAKEPMTKGSATTGKPSASTGDSTTGPASTTPAIAPPADDDEIDWGDEDTGAASKAAAAAAGPKGQVPNPTAVPNQKVDIDPSKTSDLTVIQPSTTKKATDSTAKPTESTDKPQQAESTTTFAAGLGTTDIDAEIAKRKARAKRFQIASEATAATPTADNSTDPDAIKALERAKRFGPVTATANDGADGEKNGTVKVKGLDQALPERGHRKRDRDEEGGGRGQGKRRRQGGGGRGGRGGRGASDRNGEGRPTKGRITDDPAEKAKADARAKKFGTAAA